MSKDSARTDGENSALTQMPVPVVIDAESLQDGMSDLAGIVQKRVAITQCVGAVITVAGA